MGQTVLLLQSFMNIPKETLSSSSRHAPHASVHTLSQSAGWGWERNENNNTKTNPRENIQSLQIASLGSETKEDF